METKQEKLSQFVSNNVLKCDTMLTEDLLKEGKFSHDDIENYVIDPKEYKDYGFENAKEFEDSGENVNEIFEWWSCTDWLIEKLAKKNEPILRTDYGDYWGRTCTGQAIRLDRVIEDIYDDLQKTIGDN